jgi:septum formation protein
MEKLILASTSAYRRAQLARLGLSPECVSPGTDEMRLPDEAPDALAVRLARTKALAVARQNPDAIVIGGDQVAVCAGEILEKPGSAAAQFAQLQQSRGRELRFLTAVCLVHAASGREFAHLDLTRCRMRVLDDAAIARYVEAEPAYDCCGGFKLEGRGIALFESIATEDPSALIGIPLIAVCRGLEVMGYHIP